MTSPWANPPELPPEPVVEPKVMVYVNTLMFDRLLTHINASIDHAKTHMPADFHEIMENWRPQFIGRFRPKADVPMTETHLFSPEYPIDPLVTPLSVPFPGLDDKTMFCPGSMQLAATFLRNAGFDVLVDYGDERDQG